MNVTILEYPKNIEDDLINDSKNYYSDINVTKSDLERFCRKCFRDKNFSIFSKYIVSIRIDSAIHIYNELFSLKYNLSKPKVSFSDLNFSLPKKIQNNEKLQHSIISYLKKINIFYDQIKNQSFDFNYLLLLPQICDIQYISNETIYNLFCLCTLKENNNHPDLTVFCETVFSKLNELFPFLFNDITYKVFLKHK